VIVTLGLIPDRVTGLFLIKISKMAVDQISANIFLRDYVIGVEVLKYNINFYKNKSQT